MILPHFKIIILICLVGAGLLLQQSGMVDFEGYIDIARQYADHWWLIALLITIQTVLFTFALTGSSMVWVTAALYPPFTSTLMLAAGTTLGAIAAYYFSASLSDDWARKAEGSRSFRILKNESGFFNLFALRVMPGFPHSIINYSAGFLKLRLAAFIASTLMASTIKSYVYSALIYRATTPGTLEQGIGIATVWPLLALSLFILLVSAVKRYLNIK